MLRGTVMGEFISGVIFAAILLLVVVAYLDALPRSKKRSELEDSESETTQLSEKTDEELEDE